MANIYFFEKCSALPDRDFRFFVCLLKNFAIFASNYLQNHATKTQHCTIQQQIFLLRTHSYPVRTACGL
jgi:hypothetical protein